jgi:hypothetical protein
MEQQEYNKDLVQVMIAEKKAKVQALEEQKKQKHQDIAAKEAAV